MNKKGKVVALLSASALLAGSLAGCGEEKNASGDALTYWAVMDGSSSQTLSNYSEMLMYQEIEKATGVKVEFIHPVAGSTGQEAFNTMLASSDLPDMIETYWANYAGGPDAAIEDGVIIALNDYLADWAPNYDSWLHGEKGKEEGGNYGAQAMTDNGNYYGFNLLTIGNSKSFSGLVVRADLLKKWGMEVPATIAEWEAVFAKAKEEGFKKPFTGSGSFNTGNGQHTFNTAFDVGQDYYLENGKVVYGPLQPGYKEFIAQLADWSKKGYIDQNIVTNQATDVEGNMTNDGLSMACYCYIGGGMGKMIPAMKDRNPEYDLVACPFPVLNEGDDCRWQHWTADVKTMAIAVTSSCEDVESAMKWADYIYSDEGNLLHTFGVEGDTYTVEEIDGETHYIYTDKIQKPETIGLPSVNAALYKFFRPANGPGLDQHPDYLNGYYPYQSQKDALKTWNANVDEYRDIALPPLTFTTDESSKIATLKQQYEAAFQTSVSEMILGNKSIDEYDSIVSQAKKDMYDEILKIYNDAYQRYLKKLEANK